MKAKTKSSTPTGYTLNHEGLLQIREWKLLTNDRDYVFFALQIDFAGKLNPCINVSEFCDRWDLSEGDLYKAIGELRNKGIVVSISSQLDLEFQAS